MLLFEHQFHWAQKYIRYELSYGFWTTTFWSTQVCFHFEIKFVVDLLHWKLVFLQRFVRTKKFREHLGLNVFDTWPTIQILHPFLVWRGQPTLLWLTLSQLITILFVGCFWVDSIHFPTNVFFLVNLEASSWF
jgi:hypothetical protein